MIERLSESFVPFSDPGSRREVSADPLGGFGEMLKNSIKEVDRLQKEADSSIERLASGEDTDIHDTVIAMEKADIAFKLMLQLRNKIVGAYEEIMRMQV